MSRYEKILGSDHRDTVPKNGVTKINEGTRPSEENTRPSEENTRPGEDTMSSKSARPSKSTKRRFYDLRDPRPDLPEDSIRWSLLLNIAYEAKPQLATNLYAARCEGTRLERNARWGLIMEPILPGDVVTVEVEDKTKINKTKIKKVKATLSQETGWQDRDDYKKFTQEYLKPYHEELLQLFKKIG